MLAQERQAIILDLLRENHFIKLTDIAERFQISNLTARRDLDALKDQQMIRRVYGGAVLIDDAETTQPAETVADKRSVSAEKKAICAMAASMVQEGDAISLLGYGTTAMELAKLLKHRSNLTILTAALPVAAELAGSNNTIYILGGKIDPGEQYIYDIHSRQMLDRFCLDKSFSTCTGVSIEHGVTALADETAESGRHVMQRTRENFLLCESNKFHEEGMCVTCPISDFDHIITDEGLSEETRSAIQQLDIHLHLVPKATAHNHTRSVNQA